MHLHHTLILVIVSGVLQWLLGALWYGAIFRKSWRKLVGFADGEKPTNAAFGMIASLVGCLVLSYGLVYIVNWAGAMSATQGASLGVLCWLGFMAAPLFTQHIFEKRRVNLFAINACYWLLAMALGGLIMGGFHG